MEFINKLSNSNSSLFTNIRFRIIKIIDIGYIGIIYLITSIIISRVFDGFFIYDEITESAKPMHVRTIEIFGMTWIYTVVIYICRNLVEKLPSPLDGLYGFKHIQVKELTNAVVFVFIFMIIQEASYKPKILQYYRDYFKTV